MNLQDQVCGLELAKRLKELGVKQESYFCWGKTTAGPMTVFPSEMVQRGNLWEESECVSAFTVAELGEMLPTHIHLRKERPDFFLCKKNTLGWVIGYSDYEREGTPPIRENSEADARAKILVYLIEKKLL